MTFRRAKRILTTVFAMTFLSSQAQPFFTHPIAPEIKTLQVIADGDFSKLPVMALGNAVQSGSEGDINGEGLEISFDYLSDTEPVLRYSLVHCDSEWEVDDLSEMDYLDGFLPVQIDDVAASFNTFISYYHYSIRFPNEDIRLTASGNYALLVHEEDDPDEILAVATFSVTEQMAFVKGEVSANTDIDFHKHHQQVSLELSWAKSKLPYLDAANDLKVVVRQNRRDDTRRVAGIPSRLEAGRAVYEHNRGLIFPAGNNYRLFEFTDERYAGLGVNFVRYKAPYYVATLNLDKPRNRDPFRYDQDQNGRFLVHALKVNDEATEAEYFQAVFSLAAKYPFSQAVYLDGDFTYGQKSDDFEMEYDEEEQAYFKTILLKQGAYNYQYLVDGKTADIEGNFFETENEYDVYIYYRPNGARSDRLLGVAIIQ